MGHGPFAPQVPGSTFPPPKAIREVFPQIPGIAAAIPNKDLATSHSRAARRCLVRCEFGTPLKGLGLRRGLVVQRPYSQGIWIGLDEDGITVT